MSPSLEGGVGGLTEIPVSTLVALIVAPEQVHAERDPKLLELKRMVLATVRSLHSKRNYAKALTFEKRVSRYFREV